MCAYQTLYLGIVCLFDQVHVCFTTSIVCLYGCRALGTRHAPKSPGSIRTTCLQSLTRGKRLFCMDTQGEVQMRWLVRTPAAEEQADLQFISSSHLRRALRVLHCARRYL